MINKVLPAPGLPGSKSSNNSKSSVQTTSQGLAGLDFLENDSKSDADVKGSDIESKSTSTAKPKVVGTQGLNKKESNDNTQETGFKKSLKSAITDKKSDTTPITTKSVGKNIPVEDKQEIELDELDDVGSNFAVPPSLVAIKAPTNPEDQRALEQAEANGEVQAVMKFMKSMENEFGVSPRELVSVMSQMALQIQSSQVNSPQGQQMMGLSSENNQAQIFQKLGLEGAQIRRAEYLYQNMLKEMAQDSMSNYSKEQDQQASIQILSPTEIRKRDMNQSIDRLNQSFFMNDTRPAYGKGPMGEVAPLTDGKNFNKKNVNQKESSSESKAAALGGAMVLPQGMEMIEPQAMQIESTLGPSNLEMRDLTKQEANDSSSPAVSTGLPLAGLMMQVPSGGGAGNSFDSSSGDSQESRSSQFAKTKSVKEADVATEFTTNASSVAGAKSDVVKTPGADVFSLTAPAVEAQRNDVRAEDAANVKNLIQSAQVLLRQGGGEMKVQMSPEGLGQVDLRVAVKEGKVDIQILAHTADTKRLLERGIGDLKSSLAGHRLEVSNVKVDVSQNTERDLTQQNGDQMREQARQFLGQFRDERQAMRSFGDLPRLRSYKPSVANQVSPEAGKDAEPAVKNSSRLNVIA